MVAFPIRHMTDAMEHRGPDADGFYEDEWVAFGHRRLAIIDLSTNANQPFIDPSGRYVLIFNGEIYNFQEIRKKISNYQFTTHSDTEVLLAAFISWGIDCVHHLKGMFAFAIWDKQENSLFLVRDRMGIKPLYFYSDDQNFVFASEVRAILASGLVPRKISRKALVEYFIYQSIGSSFSIVDQVFQLEAGSWMNVKDGKVTTQQYWNLTAQRPPVPVHDVDAIRKDIRALMRKAIEHRMISDVPVGAFLSGGIDSSAVVGLMSEVSANPINTFNISFGEAEFDESHYAQLVANKFNTRHHTIKLDPLDFLAELDNGLTALDSPSADGLNTYIVSKAIKREGITVALSGIGGDELFAGYPIFEQFRQLKQQQNLYENTSFLRGLVNSFVPGESSRKERIRQIISAPNTAIENIYPVLREILTPELLSTLTRLPTGDIFTTQLAKNLAARKTELNKLPLISQVSCAEYLGYTQHTLLKDTDQMSMAVSLEVREPFFDHDLIEYVLAIPDDVKKPVYPKSLLVESLKPLLPDEIVHRKKQGFTLPWKHWMKHELKAFCSYHIRGIASRDFINRDGLLYFWNRFLMDDESIRWTEIWMFVVLNHWLERNELE